MVRAQSITLTLVYTYNGDGLLAAQRVNTATSTFVWDLAAGLPVVISDTAAVYLRTPDGALLAEQRGGQWAYPLVDSLGNVRQWSSDAGYIVGLVEYDPFGTRAQPEGTVNSPYGYTGEYRDAATGIMLRRRGAFCNLIRGRGTTSARSRSIATCTWRTIRPIAPIPWGCAPPASEGLSLLLEGRVE